MDEDGVYVACDDGAVYGATFGSSPQLLARGTPYSSCAIAIDQTRVFFMSKATEVSTVPKAGGSPSPFQGGLQFTAMSVHGSDLVGSVFKVGFVRVPLSGGSPQTLAYGASSFASTRVFTVAGDSIFFLDRVGNEKHAFAASFATSTLTDFGRIPWIAEQIAVAGDTLFDGDEIDVPTSARRKMAYDDCTAFVTDGAFVFAECIGVGVIGRRVGATHWVQVADVLAHRALLLNSKQVCWPDRGDGDIAYVRCARRSSVLR